MGAHLTKGATSHGKSYSPADGPVRRAVVSLFVCQPIGGHGTAKSSRPSCSNAFLSLLLRCTSRSDCCSSCSGRGVSSYFTLWQVRSHFLTHRILSLALARFTLVSAPTVAYDSARFQPKSSARVSVEFYRRLCSMQTADLIPFAGDAALGHFLSKSRSWRSHLAAMHQQPDDGPTGMLSRLRCICTAVAISWQMMETS